MIYFLFLFFKQKTAYEMRISDWSSDVCSSDLIGGTGVLTVGALLGMAAHLDGKGCTILDMTGMAQKGGAVASHIRIGRDLSGIYTSRLSDGMCDVLIEIGRAHV